MCGIVGILGREQEHKEIIVRKMADSIKHRGPDDDGFFHDDHVGLGMRRLAIIDLASGNQPIESTDGNQLIFFNGEIYNYKELRDELSAKGHTFKTHSDTEVILHVYSEYGKAGISKLRGMFTFCIYDKTAHSVFLARDFFGIKPLYYFKSNDTILGFASEIKALLIDPRYKKEINDDAVFQYLRFQYNPLEETFFKHIFSLRPGHCMTIDVSSGTHSIEQYWKFEFAVDENLQEHATAEHVLQTMKDSVAHHMISDVPVGSFLSGGVDSSIIATLMNEIIEKEKPGTKNKTFTVGFKELSEGAEARETSDILQTDHTEINIDKTEYFTILPKLVWHFDEPVADPSAIALYFVAREARNKVKVVLSGEGADELFGGYTVYLAPIVAKKLAWLPNVILKMIADVFPDMWGKNYLRRASSKLSDWYIGNASIFTKEEQEKLWTHPIRHPHESGDPESLISTYTQASDEKISDSTTMQLVDINTWLVGDILAKADKMTMANSLELRVPFLDKQVADLARTLPDNLKWKNGQTKYILRQAFSKIIPETSRNRRKLGFPTPLRAWLSKDSGDIAGSIRTCPYIQSHMNMTEVEKVIDEHTTGKKDTSRKIYLLYMLALWHQVFFEK